LSKEILNQIVDLIVGYKEPEKIVIFGSRASDNFRDTSDIDIAIFGKDWSDRDINIVKHIIDERIKTPLKFDVINYYTISKHSLKQNIREKGEVIYEP
jgi:predicted nucleotidyltransferase